MPDYALIAEAAPNAFPCPWQLTMTANAAFSVRVDVSLNGTDFAVYREGDSGSNKINWQLDMIASIWRVYGKSDTDGALYQGTLKPIWKGT